MKVPMNSAFLKTADVKTGDLITFIDEGEVRESQFKTEEGLVKIQFNIGVKLADGEEKILTMNNTSKRNIVEAYGDESKEWIGKQAVAHVVNERIGKEFKDVLYLTHPNKNLKGEDINF